LFKDSCEKRCHGEARGILVGGEPNELSLTEVLAYQRGRSQISRP
jgi:hypothetical protein